MLKTKPLFIIIFFMLLTIICNCKTDTTTGDPYDPDAYNPQLRNMSSTEDIENYFRNAAKEYAERYINYMYSYKSNYTGLQYSESSDTVASPSGSSDLQYSETNVQEQGVDEADLVKTDGNYIYLVNDKYFMIFKSWPASDLHEVARVAMTGYPREMFLYNNKVIIFTNMWQYYSYRSSEFDSRSYSYVKISIYDISNKSQPVLERETYIEGSYITSRRINNKVFIVNNTQLFSVYNILYDLDSYGLSKNEYINKVKQQIDNLTIEDFLPRISDIVYSGANKTEQLINTYENFYVPTVANGMATVHIMAYDLDDSKGALKNTGIVSHYPDVYATQSALYLVNRNYDYWFYQNDSAWKTKSSIHKFFIETAPQYIGSNAIDGYVLDQFSLSEHNNHLRVVTTYQEGIGWDWDSITTTNKLHVLKDGSDGLLEITGKIDDIAPGESLYSSRFLGDRGFLVTYEQIDPLFTVDLSDPNNPQIKGELVMPGYSSYLHPIGDNRLLGVGMNADTEGRVDGFQLSLFDVSDLANPTRIDHKIIGSGWNTYSSSLWDHHAFQYYAPLQLLAIPVSHWSWGTNGSNFFNGALLLKVTEDSIQSFGEVNHSDLYTPSDRYYWNWNRQIKRNLFIGDGSDYYLYSISGVGVKANNVNNLSTMVGQVALPNTWEDYYWHID